MYLGRASCCVADLFFARDSWFCVLLLLLLPYVAGCWLPGAGQGRSSAHRKMRGHAGRGVGRCHKAGERIRRTIQSDSEMSPSSGGGDVPRKAHQMVIM